MSRSYVKYRRVSPSWNSNLYFGLIIEKNMSLYRLSKVIYVGLKKKDVVSVTNKDLWVSTSFQDRTPLNLKSRGIYIGLLMMVLPI